MFRVNLRIIHLEKNKNVEKFLILGPFPILPTSFIKIESSFCVILNTGKQACQPAVVVYNLLGRGDKTCALEARSVCMRDNGVSTELDW